MICDRRNIPHEGMNTAARRKSRTAVMKISFDADGDCGAGYCFNRSSWRRLNGCAHVLNAISSAGPAAENVLTESCIASISVCIADSVEARMQWNMYGNPDSRGSGTVATRNSILTRWRRSSSGQPITFSACPGAGISNKRCTIAGPLFQPIGNTEFVATFPKLAETGADAEVDL